MDAQNDAEKIRTFKIRANFLIEKYHIKTLPAIQDGEVWIWNGKYYNRYGEQKLRAEILSGNNSQFLPHDATQIFAYIKADSLQVAAPLPPQYCINLENGILKYNEANEVTFINREDVEAPWDYNFTNILHVNYDPKAKCPEIDTVLQQILVEKTITEETKVKEDYDEWQLAWQDELEREAHQDEHNIEMFNQHETNMMPVPGEEDWKVVQKLKPIVAEESINEKMRKIYIFEEFLGHCLLTDYEIKKALLWVGLNDTGKTTVINIIRQFIGNENISGLTLQKFDQSTFQYAMSKLRDKMANLADEMPMFNPKTLDGFKAATGDGMVSSGVKYKEDADFFNVAKVLMAANELPTLPFEIKNSVYNRFVIVEFLNEFISGDKDTKPKLKRKKYSDEEMSGLLNRAIVGLKRLFKTNKYSYDDDFTPTIWEKWATKSTPIDEFLKEAIEVTNRHELKYSDEFVLKSDLFTEFEIYASKNNILPMKVNKFSRIISQIHNVKASFKFIDGKTERVWTGMKLRQAIIAPVIDIINVIEKSTKNEQFICPTCSKSTEYAGGVGGTVKIDGRWYHKGCVKVNTSDVQE